MAHLHATVTLLEERVKRLEDLLPAPAHAVVAFAQLLSQHFDNTELRELILSLDVDPEFVMNGKKNESVLNLIRYCERHGLSDSLQQACARARPHITWPKL